MKAEGAGIASIDEELLQHLAHSCLLLHSQRVKAQALDLLIHQAHAAPSVYSCLHC